MDAAELADIGEARNWTAIAHELGYADQAHFTNDFTRIVGRPPTDYARAHRPRGGGGGGGGGGEGPLEPHLLAAPAYSRASA